MKTRDWGMVLAVLAASMVVAGCGAEYKKKAEEADARALQATNNLNEATASLEKARAEVTKLEATLKQRTDQLAALRTESSKQIDSLKADVKRLSDELKAARDQIAAVTQQLGQANAKVREGEQLGQKLDQENKRLQGLIERLKVQPAPKPEAGTPAPAPGTAPR